VTLAYVGEDIPLTLTLGDYATNMSPRARIYSGTSLLSTVALASVDRGYYYGTWIAPSVGRYQVVYDVYTDSSYTVLSELYFPSQDEIQVISGPTAVEGGAVRQSYTLSSTTNAVIVNMWLELDNSQITANISNATLALYQSDGTMVANPPAQATPIGEGVFQFVFTPPALPIGENALFSAGSIDYSGTPAKTFRGITGLTFSRSA
jgi:hypothetical protein